MPFFQRPTGATLPSRGVEQFQFSFTGAINPLGTYIFPLDPSAAGPGANLLSELIAAKVGNAAVGFQSNVNTGVNGYPTAALCYLCQWYQDVRFRSISVTTNNVNGFANNQFLRTFGFVDKEFNFQSQVQEALRPSGVSPTTFQTGSVVIPFGSGVRMYPGSAVTIDVRLNEVVSGTLEFSFARLKD